METSRRRLPTVCARRSSAGGWWPKTGLLYHQRRSGAESFGFGTADGRAGLNMVATVTTALPVWRPKMILKNHDHGLPFK